MGEERKGLRFEVLHNEITDKWTWEFIGADGSIASSPQAFETEKLTRSHIAANKGRFGNARRAKVVTVNG